MTLLFHKYGKHRFYNNSFFSLLVQLNSFITSFSSSFFSLFRSFVCNTKRPSAKQSMKSQVCSNFQMKCPDQLSGISPQLSDEVNKMKCTRTSDMSSYFQMKCPDQMSDIFPQLSDEVHMHIRYEFIFSDFSDEVPR